MFTLIVILAVAYVVLKVLNTRAEFARRDAERERAMREAEEAAEEALEEEEIRNTAIDVEAETLNDYDVDETAEAETSDYFDAEEAEDVEFSVEGPEEEKIVIEVPEYETVQ